MWITNSSKFSLSPMCYDFVDKLITNQAYLISCFISTSFLANSFLQRSSFMKKVLKTCLVKTEKVKWDWERKLLSTRLAVQSLAKVIVYHFLLFYRPKSWLCCTALLCPHAVPSWFTWRLYWRLSKRLCDSCWKTVHEGYVKAILITVQTAYERKRKEKQL